MPKAKSPFPPKIGEGLYPAPSSPQSARLAAVDLSSYLRLKLEIPHYDGFVLPTTQRPPEVDLALPLRMPGAVAQLGVPPESSNSGPWAKVAWASGGFISSYVCTEGAVRRIDELAQLTGTTAEKYQQLSDLRLPDWESGPVPASLSQAEVPRVHPHEIAALIVHFDMLGLPFEAASH